MAERLFYVRGDVDVDTASALYERLNEAIAFDDADLVVDCAALTFIDFSGVAVLLEAQRVLLSRGRRMRIVNSGRLSERLFTVARLEEQLQFSDGAPDAEGFGHAASDG